MPEHPVYPVELPKTPEPQGIILPEGAKIEVAPKPPESTQMPQEGKCNHVNKHSLGTDGKPDGLRCARDRGHDGDHGAEHVELIKSPRGEEDVDGKLFTKKKVWRTWNDMAGIEPKDVPRGIKPSSQMELARLLIAMQATGENLPLGNLGVLFNQPPKPPE